jgi:hypothetical protein
MKQTLLGDADNEPNNEQISQIAQEACKEDFIELLLQNLPMLSWDVSRERSFNFMCTDSVYMSSLSLQRYSGHAAYYLSIGQEGYCQYLGGVAETEDGLQ